MSEKALVFRLNEYGMVLHMECLGGMQPFQPTAVCLGRTLEEIFPGKDFAIRILSTLRMVLARGPAPSPCSFDYELNGISFNARVTYYSADTLLVIVQ